MGDKFQSVNLTTSFKIGKGQHKLQRRVAKGKKKKRCEIPKLPRCQTPRRLYISGSPRHSRLSPHGPSPGSLGSGAQTENRLAPALGPPVRRSRTGAHGGGPRLGPRWGVQGSTPAEGNALK